MKPESKANIVSIAKELLELEGKATPELFIHTRGEGMYVLAHAKSSYEKCVAVFGNNNLANDSEFYVQSRNHLRTLCEALVEAHESFLAYRKGLLSDDRTSDGLYMGKRAEEWLKKYSQNSSSSSSSDGGGE